MRRKWKEKLNINHDLPKAKELTGKAAEKFGKERW
jgi:hypothetical protein